MRILALLLASTAVVLATGTGTVAAPTAGPPLVGSPTSAGLTEDSVTDSAQRTGGVAAAGHSSLLLVLAKAAGHRDSFGRAAGRRAAARVGRWLADTSAGRFMMRTNATRWLPVRVRCGSIYALHRAARRAARRAGYHPGRFAHVAVYTARCRRLPWDGRADLGGRRIWLNGNGAFATTTLAHELGHNLGLGHSGSLTCQASGRPVSLSDDVSASCSEYAYGDRYDIMGSSLTLHMSALTRWRLGWLPGLVTTLTGSANLTLHTPGSAGPGVQLVTFTSTTHTFYIELDPDGGVLVRVNTSQSPGVDDAVIDPSPGPTTGALREEIPAGQSWTAPGGVRVTVLTEDAGTAHLEVTFAAPAPTAPGPMPAPTVDTTRPEDPVVRLTGYPADGGMVVTRYNAEVDYGDHTDAVTLYPDYDPTVLHLAAQPAAPIRVRLQPVSEAGTGPWSGWSTP